MFFLFGGGDRGFLCIKKVKKKAGAKKESVMKTEGKIGRLYAREKVAY